MQTYFLLSWCSNIDENFKIREKSQKNGGGIPTETFIAQQPKAIES